MVNLSEFTENLKSDRDTQITVGLIVIFMLLFPLYFNYASNNVSSGGALGTVGDYKVSGEYTFIELESGIEGIADGDTLTLELHSDAVQSQIADKNLVAVIVNMTYDEDEEANGPPLACAGPQGGSDAPDTITATVSRGNNTASGSGQNPGGHFITAEWHDSSIIDTVVTGLSESEIMTMLEGGETGIGNYTIDITVDAVGDNCANPLLQGNNDDGEEVTYTVSLVLLDYNIVPDIQIEV